MRRSWALLVISLLVLVGGSLVYAQMNGQGGAMMGQGMGNMGGHHHSSAAMMNLDLTPDQQAKINELRQSYFKDTSKLRISLKEQQEQLQILVYADKWDKPKIDGVMDKVGELSTELAKQNLSLAHEIRNVLTPDQQAVWDAHGGPMGMGLGMGSCGMGWGMMGPGMMNGGMMMGPGMMGGGMAQPQP